MSNIVEHQVTFRKGLTIKYFYRWGCDSISILNFMFRLSSLQENLFKTSVDDYLERTYPGVRRGYADNLLIADVNGFFETIFHRSRNAYDLDSNSALFKGYQGDSLTILRDDYKGFNYYGLKFDFTTGLVKQLDSAFVEVFDEDGETVEMADDIKGLAKNIRDSVKDNDSFYNAEELLNFADLIDEGEAPIYHHKKDGVPLDSAIEIISGLIETGYLVVFTDHEDKKICYLAGTF